MVRLGESVVEWAATGAVTLGLAVLFAGTPAAASSRKAPDAEGPGFGLRAEPAQASAAPSLDFSRFNFTLPGDAARAGLPGGVPGPERSFRFTPSRSSDRRPVTVGVTTRPVVATTEAASPSLRSVLGAGGNPSAGASGYSVDMSLDWQRFSLSGGVSRINPGGAGAQRQELDIGLAYGGRRWRTGIIASTETGSLIGAPLAAGRSERLGLEAAGAVSLSRSLAVTGGLRYRTAPLSPGPLEPNREDERVYVGGALSF
ncbi:hypothetical protein [Thermaurantiacus tibetensis]|uniref:hypothetical protein n=1 Tax=Thermaurantiacus tibetensis TaxID=2759035 RepID=UPI00188FAF63|nr:hypothetical protein [Thermaurantiacus tibetensis]